MLSEDELASRVRFGEHRGVRVLIGDASAITDAGDLALVIARAAGLVQREPERSVRIVMIVRDMQFHRSTLPLIKDTFLRLQPQVRASCLVGVGGLQRVVLQVLNRLTARERPVFDTVDEALAWLAAQP
jgi:hypothetical protein